MNKYKKISLLLFILSSAALTCILIFQPLESLNWKRDQIVPRQAGKTEVKEKSPVIVQLQYLPRADKVISDNSVPVKGVALAYEQRQKEIDGVSVALIHCGNERKNGFSMSFVDFMSKESEGISMNLVGGVVKNNGIAFNLLYNGAEQNQGIQVGIINHEDKNLLFDYEFKPVVKKEKFGVQAGIVNISDSPGIQFGLWNTNPNSLIKHFPLFNICF